MASWSPAHYVAQTSNVSAFAYRQTCEPMGGSSPLRIGRLYGIHDAWASIGSRVESPRGRKNWLKICRLRSRLLASAQGLLAFLLVQLKD